MSYLQILEPQIANLAQIVHQSSFTNGSLFYSDLLQMFLASIYGIACLHLSLQTTHLVYPLSGTLILSRFTSRFVLLVLISLSLLLNLSTFVAIMLCSAIIHVDHHLRCFSTFILRFVSINLLWYALSFTFFR